MLKFCLRFQGWGLILLHCMVCMQFHTSRSCRPPRAILYCLELTLYGTGNFCNWLFLLEWTLIQLNIQPEALNLLKNCQLWPFLDALLDGRHRPSRSTHFWIIKTDYPCCLPELPKLWNVAMNCDSNFVNFKLGVLFRHIICFHF